MKKKVFQYFVILTASLWAWGCFSFDIQQDVDYPKAAFQNQLEAISRLRPGTPSDLSIMAYEGDGRRLIKMSIPLSLINTVTESELGDVRHYSEEYLDSVDLQSLKKLADVGRGLLIEIMDHSENNHLLLWME